MRKTILFCLLFFTTAIFSYPTKAQDSYSGNLIYLKNGTVIRGSVIGQAPKESVIIRGENGNVFAIKAKRINRQMASNPYDAAYPANKRERSTAGYYGDINLGYGLHNPNTKVNTDFFDLQIINGYQFAYYFGLGGGFGIKRDKQGVSVPIFTNFRWEFTEGAIVPFASLNFGGNIRISSIHFGLYVEPKLGVSFSVSERSKITLGVSYALNDAIWSERYGDNIFTGGGGYSGGYDQFYAELLGAFRFSVGIKF